MSFELDKNEYIIFEARRSWFVLWSRTIGWLFSILAPVVIISILQSFKAEIFIGNANALFMVLIFSWVFIVWNVVFIEWTNHYLDLLIVTNKHLIDIEQHGLFSREVSVMSLEKIQDVTTDVRGFVPTVLGFGDLHIQTAGTEREFWLRLVDNPNYVRSKIKQAISGEVSQENIE